MEGRSILVIESRARHLGHESVDMEPSAMGKSGGGLMVHVANASLVAVATAS